MSRRHPETRPSEPPGSLSGEWHQDQLGMGQGAWNLGLWRHHGAQEAPVGCPLHMSASEHRPRQPRVPNANGENAVSGKCSLINNIKSSSLLAGDVRLPLRSAPAETCNDVLLLAGCEVHANPRHGRTHTHTQITQTHAVLRKSVRPCVQRGDLSRTSSWSLEDFINR